MAPLVIAVAIQTISTGLQRIPPTLASVLTEG
jgi:hypothetical protein